MKAKIRATGKVIDVSRIENTITKRGVEKQYVDNEHIWCTYVQSELELIKEPPQMDIVWEQRRYEIAKATMQGILSNESIEITLNNESNEYYSIPIDIAKAAITYADALITELKKGGAK